MRNPEHSASRAESLAKLSLAHKRFAQRERGNSMPIEIERNLQRATALRRLAVRARRTASRLTSPSAN